MRSSTLNLSLILALFFLNAVITDATVEETCKIAADQAADYGLCVTSLQVVPGSQTADAAGLAAIAVNLTVANATSTISKIDQLLVKSTTSENGYKYGLKACSILYSAALQNLAWSRDAIASKQYQSAREMITAGASDWVVQCGEAYKDKSGVSPLAKENENFFELAQIARAITNSLIG